MCRREERVAAVRVFLGSKLWDLGFRVVGLRVEGLGIS